MFRRATSADVTFAGFEGARILLLLETTDKFKFVFINERLLDY